MLFLSLHLRVELAFLVLLEGFSLLRFLAAAARSSHPTVVA